MINALSHRIALKLKEDNPEHPASVEVMKYAIAAVINMLGTLICAFAIAIALNQLPGTILALVSFALLRGISGGTHLKSGIACIVVTSLAANAVPLVPLSDVAVLAMTAICLLTAFFYAPGDLRKTSRIPTRFYPLLKYASLLLIASNLFIMSDIIAICFFVQCLSLVRVRR